MFRRDHQNSAAYKKFVRRGSREIARLLLAPHCSRLELNAGRKTAMHTCALGAMGILKLTCAILTASGSYTTLFIIAGSAYLVALTVMHLLVPRLSPARV